MPKKQQFPFLKALLVGAKSVHVTWDFDEQQADQVHHNWSWEKAKNELDYLLKKDLLGCSYDDILEILQTTEIQLEHLKKHPHG